MPQDALLEAVQKQENSEEEYTVRQFCSWLLQYVGPHKAVDWLRKRKQEPAQSLNLLDGEAQESRTAKRAEDESGVDTNTNNVSFYNRSYFTLSSAATVNSVSGFYQNNSGSITSDNSVCTLEAGL